MSWLYNSRSGAINEVYSPFDKALLSSGSGWHGPFQSAQECKDYYARMAPTKEGAGWVAPQSGTNATQNAIDRFNSSAKSNVDAAGQAAVKALDPLAKYDLNSWLLRIGEILLGLVLLGVGIAKLTGTTNMVAKAVKAAI